MTFWFWFELKYASKIRDNIKSEKKIRKAYSIFNYNTKNVRAGNNSFSSIITRFMNTSKSSNFKYPENKFNYFNKTKIKTESKKYLIHMKKILSWQTKI